ncbi:MAG: class II SORL domain-containing protein [Candidatus Brocadiales bacterium]
MKILGRREFLKSAGLALIGPALLVDDVLAGGACETCKSKSKGGGAPCPRCAARHGKGSHGGKVDLFKCINRVCDPNNKTKLEKKHAPVISVPAYLKANQTIYLTAQVGEIVHGMSQNHWIQWVEVYADNVLISRTEFSPNSPAAIVTVPLLIQKETRLKVLERCNLHGIWESSQMVVPV